METVVFWLPTLGLAALLGWGVSRWTNRKVGIAATLVIFIGVVLARPAIMQQAEAIAAQANR